MARRNTSPVSMAAHTGRAFLTRVARYAGFALIFLLVMLGLGVAGYRGFAGLSWIDALLNAAMILTGMGPVDPMPDDAAKIFASLYAIVGGAVYPAVTALVLYPFLHRMLAAFHLSGGSADPGPDGPP